MDRRNMCQSVGSCGAKSTGPANGKYLQIGCSVIAWVGTEADENSLALEIIESVGRSIEVDWHGHSMKPTNSHATSKSWADKTEYPPLNRGEMLAIKAFLMRPWFERLWVQQEIRLAGQGAIVACSSAHIPWEAFRSFMFALRSKPSSRDLFKSTSEFQSYLDREMAIELLCRPLNWNHFHTTIYRAEQSKCSDPRDRIYALLSIHEQGGDQLEITPNYEASVA